MPDTYITAILWAIAGLAIGRSMRQDKGIDLSCETKYEDATSKWTASNVPSHKIDDIVKLMNPEERAESK